MSEWREWREKYHKQIARQLQRLRRLRYGKPFVVITDAETGKFVQFIGSKKEPLLLDLPTLQILSDLEFQAAKRLLGAPRMVTMGPRTPKAYQVFYDGPFEEAAAAANAALDVMEKVFRAEGHELKVELPAVRASL